MKVFKYYKKHLSILKQVAFVKVESEGKRMHQFWCIFAAMINDDSKKVYIHLHLLKFVLNNNTTFDNVETTSN